MNPTSDHYPLAFIASKRNGAVRQFNVLRFSGGGANGVQWGFYGSDGTPQIINPSKLYVPTVDTSGTGSDTTARLDGNQKADFAYVKISDGMKSVRIGTAGATVKKTSCRNDEYACEFRSYSGSYQCSSVLSLAQNGLYAQGQCGLTAEGYCAPQQALRDPNAYEQRVYDENGNYIGRVDDPNAPGTNTSATINNIFSCPFYQSWTDTPLCIKTIVSNVATAISDGLSNASGPTKGIQGQISKIGSGSGSNSSLTLGDVYSTGGVNLADNVFRGAWHYAFVPGNPFTQYGKVALWGSILLLILLGALVFL